MILDFNENWRFAKEGEEPVPVTLPHDAMILEKRDSRCRSGVNSGYFPGGRYIYEKEFEIDEIQIGQSIVLHFEGVYQNCRVTVNGIDAGSHLYGYTPFDIDISDSVVCGQNKVTVFVDNSLEPNCRWYSGSGIYRPVQMLIRHRKHIETVHIETISIDPAAIKVDVRMNDGSTDGIGIEILEGDRVIAAGVPGKITLSDAKLWSAESPALYTCRVKSPTDTRELRFGIRSLSWSAETGLLVNGEEVLLRGGCIHHDHGVLGACEFEAAEERRIRILKENGFNAVRIAHSPASQITLDVCDRLGMYVMNETFDGWYIPKTYHDYARWFDRQWREDLTAMVESSRNHPSVIMYSIGNEVSETASHKGAEVCRVMRDHVHMLDASRPVTAGINVLLNVYSNMGLGIYKDSKEYKAEPLPETSGYREKKTGSAFFNAMAEKLGPLMFYMSAGKKGDRACRGAAESLDILGLNYAASRYEADAKKYPDRIMVGSETMARDLPYNWEKVRKLPQVVGDFVWSAWDYLGEACIGDWTYHSYPGLPLLAGQGMIDISGKPLASMYFMQIVWGLRKEPFIAVRPLNHAKEQPSKGAWQFTNAIDSWDWQGYEGTRAEVEVYADGARVRLILNDRVIGTAKLRKFKAMFRVPYEPGILKAEAIDENGNVISRWQLSTGGDQTVLSVFPQKYSMRADHQDLCYIPVEFTDGTGNLKPYIEQPVKIEIEGPAVLAGFGSALCKTDEVFNKNVHDSYRGRALAVLRSTGEAGNVSVTISSEGVQSVKVKIKVEENG